MDPMLTREERNPVANPQQNQQENHRSMTVPDGDPEKIETLPNRHGRQSLRPE
jgi:hypothetical protein